MPIPSLKKTSSARSSHRWRTRQLRSRHWRRDLLTRLAITGLLALAVLIAGTLAWVSRDLPTAEGIIRRTIPQSTKIYDRTGEHLLYDIHGEEKRTAVELASIPDSLKYATITAEDRNFYEHKGFRFTSMVRSLVVNLLRGGKVQGGSTITQQFIKNAILTNEKLYTRKIKELILAYQIERKFTKDEILKLYFNEIPYGSNAYGAEAAAQTYFGKSVTSLSLAESAVLAAMAKAPTYYSPWGTHQDELIGRQHYILDAMAEEGYITPAEADTAKTAALEFKERREDIIAPHFVFYIREALAEKYGERAVEQGGLKIITTLDLDKQKLAEAAVAAQAETNEQRYGATNASLVAIDVPTNQILALVGSRDFFNDDIDGQVNVALRPRQPGSSFKPVVYGAALALGFTPETMIFDVNTIFKTETKDYAPKNYDLKEHGPVSLRQALAGSLNIPAVKVLYLTGIDRVLGLAKRFGYTTFGDRSRFGLSIVLGGAEVKLLEHTATFATLAREGVTKPIASILRVEDFQGGVLEEWQEETGEKVLEPQIARELTSILSDNKARSFIFGAQNRLTLADRPVAAKTGTTNDYHDAWTLGYTPQLAAGVWVGNSNNDEMKRGADGSIVAAPIWQQFMNQALTNTPVQIFTLPEPKAADKPILKGLVGGEMVELDRASGLRATNLTPISFRIQKVFGQYHTILRYITPGDPLGPPPANPESDPQYQTWEEAVRRWATEHNFQDEQPPEAYDNLHVPQNQPQLSFVSPGPNQTITNNPAVFRVAASAPRGVSRVTYFLDDQEIGTVRTSPFSLNFPVMDDWANGYHTLTARAYDDIDNSNQASTTFNLLVTPLPSSSGARFINLNNGQSLNVGSLPFEVKIELNDPPNLKQVDLYLIPQNEPSRWLGVATAINSTISFTWPQNPPGSYTLSLVLTDRGNRASPGPKVTITLTSS